MAVVLLRAPGYRAAVARVWAARWEERRGSAGGLKETAGDLGVGAGKEGCGSFGRRSRERVAARRDGEGGADRWGRPVS